MESKYNLEPTKVSWISRDSDYGDFVLTSDLFEIHGHDGFGIMDNNDANITYRVFPKTENGQLVLDDDGNEVMEGEYFLTLYLENEMLAPVVKDGVVLRDDRGEIVLRKQRKIEFIATDLTPRSEGRTTRIANRFARKMASVRKYRAKDPRTVKRGRKAKVQNVGQNQAAARTFQVELDRNSAMWCVVKLGQADPVAQYPGTVDGRNAARAEAHRLNEEHEGE